MPAYRTGAARPAKAIILIAPVIGGLVIFAAWLLLKDPPPLEPEPVNCCSCEQEPCDPQPDHAPEIPLPDGADPVPAKLPPGSAAEADLMLNEALRLMERVRDRLQLKYMRNHRAMDPTWKLDNILRKKRPPLAGMWFQPTDFLLEFPKGDRPVAEIRCLSAKGAQLLDGALLLRVDLGSGSSELEGVIRARDDAGGILLSGASIEGAIRTLRGVAGILYYEYLKNPGLDPDWKLDELMNGIGWKNLTTDFKPADITWREKSIEPPELVVECRTTLGAGIAGGAITLTVDLLTRETQLDLPSTYKRQQDPLNTRDIESRARWLLQYIGGRILTQYNLERGSDRVWNLANVGIKKQWFQSFPLVWLDISVEIDRESEILTVSLHSSYGRPLPDGPLTYTVDLNSKKGEFNRESK